MRLEKQIKEHDTQLKLSHERLGLHSKRLDEHTTSLKFIQKELGHTVPELRDTAKHYILTPSMGLAHP
ncbi:hypothetical protein H2199_004550 [Coniosporium tulheliwenetii]|uniref:Uncharacterized protein n=1 Tax=Coniosporium tulheliwenetii TaxID=3383036 RepID=A0ACC2Z5M7_9PEZI|nr:hypothetical protein H2199_004550 [Cladosporium sp. JES 115]